MPELFKNKYRISSARLQTWNYADNGMYFITICTENRECFFGDIVETRCIASPNGAATNGTPGHEMQLNDLGETVGSEWLKTLQLRADMNLELGEYVVMPNHFHGIIWIGENQYNSAIRYNNKSNAVGDATHRVSTSFSIEDPPKNKFGPQSKNLASIIRGFKSSVTTYARKNDIAFDWQARFHDHIITSRDEYFRISNYIINNPNNWPEDKFYKK